MEAQEMPEKILEAHKYFQKNGMENAAQLLEWFHEHPDIQSFGSDSFKIDGLDDMSEEEVMIAILCDKRYIRLGGKLFFEKDGKKRSQLITPAEAIFGIYCWAKGHESNMQVEKATLRHLPNIFLLSETDIFKNLDEAKAFLNEILGGFLLNFCLEPEQGEEGVRH